MSLPDMPQGPRKPRRSKRGLNPNTVKWLKRGTIAGLIMLLALGIGTSFALVVVYQQLPDVRQLEHFTLPQATTIYTESGRMLTRLSAEGRYDPIPLTELPQHVQDAVISAEDRRFWQHEGVDFLGLARAIVTNLRKGRTVSGASTITQQLIKNLFLSPEQSAKRKIAEALLAFQLERHYSKQQILEMYLNLVFLGHNVYGVEAASQIYYGKSARSLTIAEAALLAGIIRSPEYLSPYHHPDDANKIKEIVLNQMAEDGRITQAQKDQALKQKIHLAGLRTSYPYPYFLDYVMFSLRREFGDTFFRSGGWKVYTTIDPELQAMAERTLQRQVPRLKRNLATQAALVTLDPRSGHIKAMVGGVNYQTSQFNRAFQAQRQVGSTFKPFVYLAGFEAGKRLEDTELDAPVNFGGYRPHNYDRRYHGKVTLLQALTNSLNIPTIKLANEIGMGRVVDVAKRAGVQSPIGTDLASAIGASEMNLIELTSAYGSFATGGAWVAPTAIAKITDSQGNVVREYAPNPQQVFDKNAVGQLNVALKNVIAAGTGTAARIGRPAAGKTGTTDRAFDTWFVGYVPQLVTGIWAGNDNPSATYGGGGTLCAPIWGMYMLDAVRGLAPEDFAGFTLPAASPSPSASASASPSASASNSITEVSSEPSASAPNPIATATATAIEASLAPTPADTPLPLPTQEATPAAESAAPLLNMSPPDSSQ